MLVVDLNEAAEKMRSLIINHDLPRADMAVYGSKCPYCGKSDRIRYLEKPERLTGFDGSRNEKVHSQYAQCWVTLIESHDSLENSLGVCKFCQNLLWLNPSADTFPLSI